MTMSAGSGVLGLPDFARITASICSTSARVLGCLGTSARQRRPPAGLSSGNSGALPNEIQRPGHYVVADSPWTTVVFS